MTTVAQMIEWMKTLPPDAEVWCAGEDDRQRAVYGPVDIECCITPTLEYPYVFIDIAQD